MIAVIMKYALELKTFSSITCVKVFNVSTNCKGFEGNEVGSEHVHKLPRRAQVRSTFYNGISLRVRQGTVFNYMINTNFACSKRKRSRHGFLKLFFFPEEAKMDLGFMHFHAPHAAPKQKNNHKSKICYQLYAIFRVCLSSLNVTFCLSFQQ